MLAATRIDTTAQPGPTLSTAMPSDRLAVSSVHKASALRRATSAALRVMRFGP
jgi:hypothetical protein